MDMTLLWIAGFVGFILGALVCFIATQVLRPFAESGELLDAYETGFSGGASSMQAAIREQVRKVRDERRVLTFGDIFDAIDKAEVYK